MAADSQGIPSGLPRPFEALKAAGLLLVMMPLLVVIGLSILLSSPGPVFFRQRRVGRGGREFTMFKFRTMSVNTEHVQVTSSGDARVTPVGRLLRRLKLDELPELWNVVAGDLSLVGHRPEVPRYVDLEDALWRQVLVERPGITHPVTLRLADEERLIAAAGGDPERYYVDELLPFKLRGYLAYQRKRSFWKDVWVLAATAAALVGWRWYPAVRLDELRAETALDKGRHG
jgi:lipopolysaccharide/colanic/teichoic acid biosynthesis glycosyltransferase